MPLMTSSVAYSNPYLTTLKCTAFISAVHSRLYKEGAEQQERQGQRGDREGWRSERGSAAGLCPSAGMCGDDRVWCSFRCLLYSLLVVSLFILVFILVQEVSLAPATPQDTAVLLGPERMFLVFFLFLSLSLLLLLLFFLLSFLLF